MIKVTITGYEKLQRIVAAAPRQFEVATQRAILHVAQGVRDAETQEMARAFDRPTRWTMGAMKVKAVDLLTIDVGVVDPDGYYKRAANYLGTQVGGGARKVKAMEKALQTIGAMPKGWIAVPGAGAKIDAYGNMSVGQIRRILSWFNAGEMRAGSKQNMTPATRDKRRAGTRKTAGFEYFVVMPRGVKNMWAKNDSRASSLKPGIYQRFFFTQGKAIKPILIFVKTARYQIRFKFEEVAQRTVEAMWDVEFHKAIDRELFS